jgi:hypothetical protein
MNFKISVGGWWLPTRHACYASHAHAVAAKLAQPHLGHSSQPIWKSVQFVQATQYDAAGGFDACCHGSAHVGPHPTTLHAFLSPSAGTGRRRFLWGCDTVAAVHQRQRQRFVLLRRVMEKSSRTLVWLPPFGLLGRTLISWDLLS